MTGVLNERVGISVAEATTAAAVNSALTAVISADVGQRVSVCRWVAYELDQALTVLDDSDRRSCLPVVRRAVAELSLGEWDRARRALIEARTRLIPRPS